MPSAVIWTPERDNLIATMRGAGRTWKEIAQAMGHNPGTIQQRAAKIGVDVSRLAPPESTTPGGSRSRPPLPSGHPLALQVLAEAPPLDLE